MFNSTLSISESARRTTSVRGVPTLFLLDVGLLICGECFELCHLPLNDALGGKRTKKFSYLIFRLGFNYEGPGESTDGDTSRTDLAIIS